VEGVKRKYPYFCRHFDGREFGGRRSTDFSTICQVATSGEKMFGTDDRTVLIKYAIVNSYTLKKLARKQRREAKRLKSKRKAGKGEFPDQAAAVGATAEEKQNGDGGCQVLAGLPPAETV
jgi:hypothetical protein